MTDTITPAFLAMAKNAGPAASKIIFSSTERRRILGGKSARLLRRGDRVALRDLKPRPRRGYCRRRPGASIGWHHSARPDNRRHRLPRPRLPPGARHPRRR
jgi:hypothetical protein